MLREIFKKKISLEGLSWYTHSLTQKRMLRGSENITPTVYKLRIYTMLSLTVDARMVRWRGPKIEYKLQSCTKTRKQRSIQTREIDLHGEVEVEAQVQVVQALQRHQLKPATRTPACEQKLTLACRGHRRQLKIKGKRRQHQLTWKRFWETAKRDVSSMI